MATGTRQKRPTVILILEPGAVFANDSHSDDDAALMRRLAIGDDLALSALMSRWRDRVGSFLIRLTGSHATALDLTQETFVRLYLNRSRYQPRGVFSTYLFAIAANLARDHARWVKRHPSIPLDDPETSLPHVSLPGPDQSALARDDWRAVQKALLALPADLREAIVLFACEDLSHSEIAVIAGCSVKAVETRIYRARRILKEELGADLA